MPTSAPEGKQFIKQWVESHDDIDTILDIGVGKGTYAKLLGAGYKYIGVEAYRPYIDTYRLNDLYDTLIVDDVRDVELPSADLIIFGDVLEHMPKEDARKLIQKSSGYKHCVVSLPIGPWPQGAIGGNEYERHVAEWNSGDSILFEGFQSYEEGHISVFYR